MRMRAFWLGTCIFYVLWSMPTLVVSPSIYPDETQILDYGRGVFEPSSEWSIVWNVLHDRATVPFHFLGVSLAEVGCRLGGGITGARMAGLLSGVLSASMFFLWARAAGVSGWLAWLVAAAFLTDPLVVAVSRSGRVDMWAIFFALAACWMLRSARGWGGFVGAGAAAAASASTWITSIYLAPVLAVALCSAPSLRSVDGRIHWRRAVVLWLTFVLAAATAFIVLFWLRIPFMQAAWQDFASLAQSAATKGQFITLQQFVDSFRVTPFVLPAMLIGAVACWKTNKALALAAIGTTLLLLPTNIYHFRAVYCLPSYYMVILAGASVACGYAAKPKAWKIAVTASCGILFLVNAGITLGLRQWIGMQRAEANRPEKLFEIAESTLGAGQLKVYDANMTFYYAGRELGWQMYRPLFAGVDPSWNDERFANFLQNVEVAILPVSDERRNMERFSNDEKAVLKACGFVLVDVVHANPPESLPTKSKGWWDRVLLGGGPSYGSYEIYRRPASTTPKEN